MSLSATLANALSGLNVAQQALSVTANNVANANTPGYSREVELAARHLFADSRSDSAPVVLDPAFSGFGAPDATNSPGDAVELSLRAAVNQDLACGVTIDRAGFQELIGALRARIESDGSDDQAMLESALELVNAALPKITGDRSELSARQAALERINRGDADAELDRQHQISGIEDVDLIAAITRLSRDQMVIESAMATVARLSRLGVVDFRR